MIIMQLSGGLGNQLFQYAFGRYIANKLNTELKLDIRTCLQQKNLHHNYYRLGAFNIVENFATTEEIQSAHRFDESKVQDVNEILSYQGDIYLDGYWCLEKYFIEIRDILLQELTLKNPLGKNSATWREKILYAECAVSLHIRMGDFLLALIRNSNRISYDFYEKSIAELKKENPNLTVFVFSDDLQWCKENLTFGVTTEFVEGCETDDEEMYLMSLCKHNINPQGTFGWWGAWLNKNPDKKVFLADSSLMLDNTVNISVGENARPLINFPPNLSIIVYIENKPTNIAVTLESILNQEFKDYEVILMDASTDSSGKICKQVAVNDNVVVITLDSSVNKFSAWNNGLDVARSEYILFLSTKDFIFENTAKMVAQMLYNYLKMYLEPLGKYIYVSNYGDDFPNIICDTQYLAEDDGGNITINELPYKKFLLNVDEALKDLPNIAELNIPSDQKLMMLATKAVNTSLSTKFFKRKFLNENNIKFHEGEGTDAELLFLVDTFLTTEKITFVPQPFGGRLK